MAWRAAKGKAIRGFLVLIVPVWLISMVFGGEHAPLACIVLLVSVISMGLGRTAPPGRNIFLVAAHSVSLTAYHTAEAPVHQAH